MAELDPKLHEDVFEFLVDRPVLRLPQSREDALLPALRHRDVLRDVEWVGSPRRFTSQLIATLSHEDLCKVLRAIADEDDVVPHIEVLCKRIMIAARRLKKQDSNLDAYHLSLRVMLEDRYQVASQFVSLHLLAGHSRVDYEWEDSKAAYDSLRELIHSTRENTYVLLGSPGSGKSTLLRRLAAEECWAELEDSSGRAVMLVSLNAYRSLPDGTLPSPRDWLAQRWVVQTRGMIVPDFQTLLDQGRFLLLMDGLNEIPWRDRSAYRLRIRRWNEFISWNQMAGNTLVFSCRTIDYSVPLGSREAPVRQLGIQQLNSSQIRSWLKLWHAERADKIWEEINSSPDYLELSENPWFLRMICELKVADGGPLPRDSDELITALLRERLHKEVAIRRNPLFDIANGLLDPIDHYKIHHRMWNGTFDIPEGGPFISLLARLAWHIQKGAEYGGLGGLGRLNESDAVALLDHPLARQVLKAGIQLNILDRGPGRREIIFYHQLIQEYFASLWDSLRPKPQRHASLTEPIDVHIQLQIMPTDQTITSSLICRLQLSLRQPNSQMPVNPLGEGGVEFMFDLDVGRQLAGDPEATGRWLAKTVFADPIAQRALNRLLFEAETADIRIRLQVERDLHALNWETLDLDGFGPISLRDRLLFSRYVPASRLPNLSSLSPNPLRVLASVATPTGLNAYGLKVPDRNEYVQLAREQLLNARVDSWRANLEELRGLLADDYDVLFLVAHGRFGRKGPSLFLEDNQGGLERVDGHQLETWLADLRVLPRLIILISCEGGGSVDGTGDPISAIGLRFVSAGIPAVVAIQGMISFSTVKALLRPFFAGLAKHGKVDLALAEARRFVAHRPDAWAPVLFSAVDRGELWNWQETASN